MRHHDGGRIVLGDWNALGSEARAIRFDVFVHEQHVDPDTELDDMDAVSLHAVAYDSAGVPAGTGRLLPDGHIGRMAVSKAARRSGIGGALLVALMQQAKARGHDHVLLSAQIQATPFYAVHGFVRSRLAAA